MVAIIDYGVGNLFSLKSSLEYIGADAAVTDNTEEIAAADRIILPGVGAFADAMDKLTAKGLDKVVKREAFTGKPLMGICLGMQMLFEKSFEYGEHRGLGLIDGAIKPIRDVVSERLKVPQIGWNRLEFTENKKQSVIFSEIPEGAYVYFVHSYYAADCEKNTVAVCDYGAKLTAAVIKDNVIGCQFHPEKSGETGLEILRAFCGKDKR